MVAAGSMMGGMLTAFDLRGLHVREVSGVQEAFRRVFGARQRVIPERESGNAAIKPRLNPQLGPLREVRNRHVGLSVPPAAIGIKAENFFRGRNLDIRRLPRTEPHRKHLHRLEKHGARVTSARIEDVCRLRAACSMPW
jgi:hypothetical protein